MEIVKDILQGSEEWLQLRLGVATASNFSKIITSTGKLSTQLEKYAIDLASQMLLEEPEEVYKTADMERGNILEDQAREAYEQETLDIVEQVSFIHYQSWGYSPDGLVGQDGIIEIKCPKATTHTKYLFEDRLPPEYKAQVQGGLMASQRKWCDFVSFHPLFKGDKKLFIKRVFRDEDFINSLKAGIDKVIQLRDKYLEKLK